MYSNRCTKRNPNLFNNMTIHHVTSSWSIQGLDNPKTITLDHHLEILNSLANTTAWFAAKASAITVYGIAIIWLKAAIIFVES